MDPSISSTGLVIFGEGVRKFLRVQTAERGDDISSRIQRMRESVRITAGRIEEFTDDVDLVAIESPAFGMNNGQTHQLAGHWWLTVHALEKYAPIATVSTGTLKKFATGNGAAKKQQVHAAAVAAFPGEVPARFKEGNDIGDASVLASMAAAHLGREFGGVFSPSGMASVQVVRWPLVKG